MSMRPGLFRSAVLVMASAMATLSGCGSEPSEPTPPPVVTQSVTVAPTTVALMPAGATRQLVATVTTSAGPATNPAVAWSSSNTAVATVAGTGATGTVTSVGAGTATITATSGGRSGSAEVTVALPAQTLTVTLAGDGTGTVTSTPAGINCTSGVCTGTFAAGTSVALAATAGPPNRLESWAGACAGSSTCTILMSEPRTVTATFRNVPARVASVTINPQSIILDEGDSAQATVVLRDSAGNVLADRTVTWSSSDTVSAVVLPSGRIAGRAEADTLIVTASIGGVSGTAKVKVRSLFFLATDVSAGGGHTCAIRVAGGAWCWGDSQSGELGNPSAPFGTSTAVVGGASYIQVTAGTNHTCGRNAAGDVFCWGYNREGQVGDSLRSFPGTATPVPIAGGRRFAGLIRGAGAMCALTSTANTYCWGFNGFSGGDLLGVGNPFPTVSFPELVRGGFLWKMISVSSGLSCGIATTDLAYCWGGAPSGNSSVGRLGDGTRSSRGVPTALFGSPRYRIISAGGAMGCGIDMSNDPWCWGGNNRGQLGDGTFVNTDRPGRVQTSQKFVSLVTGDSHACGLTAQGAAWCWGDGRSGELGQGSAVGSNVPVPVQQGSLVFIRLSALAMHTCAIATDRRVYCWGSNASNQLGFGGGGRSLIPLPVARPER